MTNLIYARIVAALFVGVALATASAVAQTTWYVDDDGPGDPGPGDPTVSDPLEDGSINHPFDAIQEGINVAISGDTILVLVGTYTGMGNRDIDYGGKAIIVRSENGPDTCIIDCEGDGRGFYFHSWETAASVVGGFTITNGYTSGFGGGIRCESSHPTITNCTVAYNGAYDGGGIYCQCNSSPTITGCTIKENTAANNGGGIGSEQGGSPTINGCTITQNTAVDAGGGMHCDQSDPMLINCVIMDNTAMWGGGFHCSYYADPTITIQPRINNRTSCLCKRL